IYGQSPGAWDGRWTLLVIPPRSASRRGRPSEDLKWLGFGRLNPSLYAHPGCTPGEARRWLGNLPGAADGLLLEGRSGDLAGDRPPAAPPAALGTLRRVCPLRGIGAQRAPLHPFNAGRSGPTAAPAVSAPAGQPPVSATSIRFTVSTPLVGSYVPSAAIARTA